MKYTKEQVEIVVNKNNNIKDCLIDLIGQNSGNNYTYFISLIKKYDINTSHFLTKKELQQIARNKVGGSFGKKINNEELFIKNSQYSNPTIKSRIRKDNLIRYICECCGQDENWRGKIMTLILDHKDGINNNNELSNLRFLCSNCDSIQDTYKSKNIKLKVLKPKQNQNNEFLILENETINKIKESNIDFSKLGWRIKLGKLLDRTPQYSGKFVKDKIPELWETCRKNIK